MILPLLLASLAFLVLVPILLPLLRGARATEARGVFDQAVYRDQLRELDRDIARGLITATEAQSARVEIQRRLLAAASTAPTSSAPSRAPILARAVAALVSLGSVGLYTVLGEPTRLSDPAADAQRVEVERLVARIKERLEADPSSQEGWRLLARTSASLADWDTAITAYQRAITLGDTSVDTLAAYGEVLVARADGTVIPVAREAFGRVLAMEPDNGMARFYMAQAAGQDGQPAEAVRQLQALAADLPEDVPVRPEIGRRMAAFATQAGIPVPPLAPGRKTTAAQAMPIPGPDQETIDAAANMPAADRNAMIRTMVARLAERLEREPEDLDGWMRLGRSWLVLGDAGKAADAYERAAALRPEDVSVPLRAVEALLQGLAVTDPLPPRAVAILRRIETIKPNEPAALWYLGMVAAREGHKEMALSYWRRLRDGLPPDHPDAAMVNAAITALGGR